MLEPEVEEVEEVENTGTGAGAGARVGAGAGLKMAGVPTSLVAGGKDAVNLYHQKWSGCWRWNTEL